MLRLETCAPDYSGYRVLEDWAEERLLDEIPFWHIDRTGPHATSRSFTFDHPIDALGFMKSVAILADEERHYPSLRAGNQTVTIMLTTPEAGGITDSDFVLAAKIDHLYSMFAKPGLGTFRACR